MQQGNQRPQNKLDAISRDFLNWEWLAWNVHLERGGSSTSHRPSGQPTERAMYLVELQPGIEVLYQTVADLTAAIRCGDVGSQSRIFHRSSSTWISITVHPEYKRVSGEGEPVALHSLKRKRWTFFNAENTEEPVEDVARQAEASQTEPKAEPFRRLVPEEGKPSFRHLVRGTMRRLRIPGLA